MKKIALILLFAALSATAYAEEKSAGTHGDFLRSKITAASPLDENGKTEIVDFVQGQYQSGVSFKDKWNSEWIGFFEATVNDPSKKMDAMKEEIKNYWNRKKHENRQAQEQARKDAIEFRGKMRAEL